MKTAPAQSFSPIELAWVRAQTPENLSITTVALICSGPLDPACLKSRIEDRLLPERRLRQKMGLSHGPLARPRWQEHEGFQLSDHFLHLEATAGQPAAALARVIGDLSSRPLDTDLPLWQIHLAALAGKTSAVIFRLHAAVADSRAAAALALRLTDAEDPAPLSELGLEHHVPLQPLRDRAGKAADATRMLCQLITSRADQGSPLRRPPTSSKTIVWSDPVDLARTRSQASQSGLSLTESLLVAVVGALRKAVQRHDVPAEDIGMRAVVSLNLRHSEDPLVGTRSALGLLRLPLHAASPAERAEAVREELARLSQVPEDLAVLGCETGHGLSMTEIEEQSLRLLSQKATVALSILDGPTRRQQLCKQPLSAVMWWPALTGDIALGISLVSYAGQVRFCVSCDSALHTDGAALAEDMATAATAS